MEQFVSCNDCSLLRTLKLQLFLTSLVTLSLQFIFPWHHLDNPLASLGVLMSIDLHDRVSCAHLFKASGKQEASRGPCYSITFHKRKCLHTLSDSTNSQREFFQRARKASFIPLLKLQRFFCQLHWDNRSRFAGHFKKQMLISFLKKWAKRTSLWWVRFECGLKAKKREEKGRKEEELH